MVPMSDVPAAAGWTLVAVLVLKQRPLAAGIVAGLDAPHPPQPDSAGAGAGVRMAAEARAAHPLRDGHRARAAGDHDRQRAALWRAADDRVRVVVRVVCVRRAADSTCATTSSGWCRRRRRSSFSRSCRCSSATRCARTDARSVAARVSRGARRADVSFVPVLRDLRSLVLSAIPAAGVSGAVRPAGSGDSLARVEASRRGARAGRCARLRGDDSVRRERRETRRRLRTSRRTKGATFAPRAKSHRARRRMRSSCRFSTAAACDTTPTESRCGTTGCRTMRSMPRFATSRRKGAARISSSTTGKRRSFAPASRRQTVPAQLGAPDRARARQPGSAHFRVAGRRPCSDAMKKGVLVFLIYCGITIALTYPLILQMGSVLPNDAGDPALNTWILWWNTQAVPFSTAWWNAPAFFPAPGVLSFSENLLGLSLISTPLYWLGAGPQTAYNVVFLADVSAQRSRRVSAGIRADEAPRRGVHRRTAVRLCAVSHRAPAADSVARVVSDAVRAARPASLSPRPAAEMARAVCARAGFCRGSATATTCCSSACSSACGFCGLRARGRGRRQFLAVSLAWVDCRDSDTAASAALSRDSRVVRLRARLRHDPRVRRRRGEPAARDSAPRAVGMAATCFGVRKGSCFRGSRSCCSLLAGAIFVRDRQRTRSVDSWTLVRRILHRR